MATSDTEDELLRLIGIEAVVEQRDSPIRTECLRAAQKLNRRGCTTIGLLPASMDVSVVGVGVNLALSLAEMSGSTVGYVDANLRWPALSKWGQQQRRPGIEEKTDPSIGPSFSVRWLRGDVALLTPRTRGAAGAGLGALTSLLENARELFSRCLVDLTGWKRLGEHLPAFNLLDGVVVVARTGLTTEDELLRINHELDARRHLGVLLLGAEQP